MVVTRGDRLVRAPRSISLPEVVAPPADDSAAGRDRATVVPAGGDGTVSDVGTADLGCDDNIGRCLLGRRLSWPFYLALGGLGRSLFTGLFSVGRRSIRSPGGELSLSFRYPGLTAWGLRLPHGCLGLSVWSPVCGDRCGCDLRAAGRVDQQRRDAGHDRQRCGRHQERPSGPSTGRLHTDFHHQAGEALENVPGLLRLYWLCGLLRHEQVGERGQFLTQAIFELGHRSSLRSTARARWASERTVDGFTSSARAISSSGMSTK